MYYVNCIIVLFICYVHLNSGNIILYFSSIYNKNIASSFVMHDVVHVFSLSLRDMLETCRGNHILYCPHLLHNIYVKNTVGRIG
jgi:hypothetical protein